jgi:hypothetical protein
MTNRTLSVIMWLAIAVLGAFAFAGIALNRNEPVSAAWLVTAAICVYLVAYEGVLIRSTHRLLCPGRDRCCCVSS